LYRLLNRVPVKNKDMWSSIDSSYSACRISELRTDSWNIDTKSEKFGEVNKVWSPIFTKISVITNVVNIPALAFYDVCFDRISKDFNNIIFR
jgi:hypothetical protein